MLTIRPQGTERQGQSEILFRYAHFTSNSISPVFILRDLLRLLVSKRCQAVSNFRQQAVLKLLELRQAVQVALKCFQGFIAVQFLGNQW